VGLLLLAFKYGVDASTHFVSPTTAAQLDLLVIALAAGTVLLILPMFAYKLFRLDQESRKEYFSQDSFTAHVFRRAGGVAAAAAILTLLLLEVVADRLDAVPPRFYLQVSLGLTLGAYAVAVLVFSRDPGEGEPRA